QLRVSGLLDYDKKRITFCKTATTPAMRE
ncbi:Crp/Fnr family transcriptional regulator, partial [Enterococcus faecium]